MSPIIRFKDVCKYYRAGNSQVTALSNVSLEIQQGDFVSVMGPSGGGKTTFLNFWVDSTRRTVEKFILKTG